MRSNNASLLLPYNTFEFTLIAEAIAASLGVALGTYIHIAASMHIFDSDRAIAKEIVETYLADVQNVTRKLMPPMPTQPTPLEQISLLARLEASLRHDYARVRYQDLLARGRDTLHDYWLAFYEVLLVHALLRREQFDDARLVAELLPDYFRDLVIPRIDVPKPRPAEGSRQLELEIISLDEALSVPPAAVAAALAPGQDEKAEITERLISVCDQISAAHPTRPVTIPEFRELQRRFLERAIRRPQLAARPEGTAGDASDSQEFTRKDVEAVLAEIRGAC